MVEPEAVFMSILNEVRSSVVTQFIDVSILILI